MQASTNDGERANASAAIGRLLQRHGHDWHDLTEILLAEPQAAPPPPRSSRGTWKRTTGTVELPRDQLVSLLDLIEDRSPFLTLKSREFVTSLRQRCHYQPTVRLSERQWAWAQDLIEQTGA